MIPCEYQIQPGTIAINVGRETQTVIVENHGDRPIQSDRTITFTKSTRR